MENHGNGMIDSFGLTLPNPYNSYVESFDLSLIMESLKDSTLMPTNQEIWIVVTPEYFLIKDEFI